MANAKRKWFSGHTKHDVVNTAQTHPFDIQATTAQFSRLILYELFIYLFFAFLYVRECVFFMFVCFFLLLLYFALRGYRILVGHVENSEKGKRAPRFFFFKSFS